MAKLIYIGKSNKKFTHNEAYLYDVYYKSETIFSVTVKSNKGQFIHYKEVEFMTYFYQNFKFVPELEYQQIIRKQKLNNINKINDK